MTEKFRNYCFRHNELNITYLSEKFDKSKFTIIKWLCTLWEKFDNPHMVDDMLITNYKERDWFYEVCDTKYSRSKYVSEEFLQEWWLNNQKYDQHISVYGHDKSWVQNIKETGSVSGGGQLLKPFLFWVELDRKDYQKRANFWKAVEDAKTLRNQILVKSPNAQIWIFTSGNNSTHIAINPSLFGDPIVSHKYSGVFKHLAQLLTDGIRHGIEGNVRLMDEDELRENLTRAYPEIVILDNPTSENHFKWDGQVAESALENCDQNIYHPNALIRQPWSWHEKGKKKKSIIDMSGDFEYDARKLQIRNSKPELLHLYLQAWDKLKESNQKRKKKVVCDYDYTYIVEELKKKFPDIEVMRPNKSGWCGPFTHYKYEDHNASVYLNIENGTIHDFGSERYSMSFDEYLIDLKSYD